MDQHVETYLDRVEIWSPTLLWDVSEAHYANQIGLYADIDAEIDRQAALGAGWASDPGFQGVLYHYDQHYDWLYGMDWLKSRSELSAYATQMSDVAEAIFDSGVRRNLFTSWDPALAQDGIRTGGGASIGFSNQDHAWYESYYNRAVAGDARAKLCVESGAIQRFADAAIPISWTENQSTSRTASNALEVLIYDRLLNPTGTFNPKLDTFIPQMRTHLGVYHDETTEVTNWQPFMAAITVRCLYLYQTSTIPGVADNAITWLADEAQLAADTIWNWATGSNTTKINYMNMWGTMPLDKGNYSGDLVTPGGNGKDVAVLIADHLYYRAWLLTGESRNYDRARELFNEAVINTHTETGGNPAYIASWKQFAQNYRVHPGFLEWIATGENASPPASPDPPQPAAPPDPGPIDPGGSGAPEESSAPRTGTRLSSSIGSVGRVGLTLKDQMKVDLCEVFFETDEFAKVIDWYVGGDPNKLVRLTVVSFHDDLAGTGEQQGDGRVIRREDGTRVRESVIYEIKRADVFNDRYQFRNPRHHGQSVVETFVEDGEVWFAKRIIGQDDDTISVLLTRHDPRTVRKRSMIE